MHDDRHDDGMGRRDAGGGEESMDERIRAELRAAFPPPPFPRDTIERDLRRSLAAGSGGQRSGARSSADRPSRTGRHADRRSAASGPAPGQGRGWNGWTARTAMAVAASLILFVAGVEYGRGLAASDGAPVPEAGTTPVGEVGATLPLSIQSAGTEYVASLARFTGEAETLSAEERRLAREVALTALFGAALELLRESGDDEMLRAVVEMVGARRGAVAQAGTMPTGASF